MIFLDNIKYSFSIEGFLRLYFFSYDNLDKPQKSKASEEVQVFSN